jgi:hypothetical protein
MVLSTKPAIIGGIKQRNGWERVLGIKEYLLCHHCDNNLFSGLESYARSQFYGTNPSPLKKILYPTPQSDVQGHWPALMGMSQVTLDYEKTKLFVLSMLWRASLAKGEFFKAINLGLKHEENLRQILLSRVVPDETEYTILILDLRIPTGETLEDSIEEPATYRIDGHRICSITIGGFQYLIYVSSHAPPQEIVQHSLRRIQPINIRCLSYEEMLRPFAIKLKKMERI